MIGIYKITSPTGKIYIGQSVNIRKRFNDYKNINKSLRQKKLNSSFKKHGISNHIFEIIEICTISQINIKERYWQDYYNVISVDGLNCQLTKTDELKFTFSDKTIQKLKQFKMSDRQRNIIKNRQSNRIVNQITKDRISENHPLSRIVLDTQTGIFYNSLIEACKYNNIKSTTLGMQLNGKTKNKTSLIYV